MSEYGHFFQAVVIIFPAMFDVGQSNLILQLHHSFEACCMCVRVRMSVCLNAQRVCRKKNCPIVCHPSQSIRSTVRVGGWKIAPL